MPFSEATLRQAWVWARGRCECQQNGHGHADRCRAPLEWEYRGQRGPGAWVARLRLPPAIGATEAENCEIVCRFCYDLGPSGPVEK